jgi:hypothetical protein
MATTLIAIAVAISFLLTLNTVVNHFVLIRSKQLKSLPKLQF